MELLFFTDRCQVYKAKASDFSDTKASVMGDYIPARAGSMDEGENAQYMAAVKENTAVTWCSSLKTARQQKWI